MTVVRSPVRSVVRSSVMGVTGYASSTPTLTALAQILALDPTALWWPENGSGWQGRTGVTLSAVGSPVGILPDLSELGGATLDEWLAAPTTPELADPDAWVDPSANWEHTATTITKLAVDSNRFSLTSDLPDKSYVIHITISDLAGGTPSIAVSGTTVLIISANGNYSVTIKASGVVSVGGTNATFTSSNISVRELPGIHAIAPTDAARPLLGRVPVTGRRNMLTYSEQIDNAAWGKQGATISANAAVAPDGTTTAEKLVEDTSAAAFHRVLQTQTVAAGNNAFSVYVKAVERNKVALTVTGLTVGAQTVSYDLSLGAIISAEAGIQNPQIESLAGDWFRISGYGSFNAGSAQLYIALRDAANAVTYTGDGTSGIYIWGVQLETGSTATAYQRVVTALDVTEAGVADTYYTSQDGVDDYFALSESIPITEEMTVVRAFGRSAAGIHSVGLATSTTYYSRDFYWETSNGRQVRFYSGAAAASSSTATGNFVSTSIARSGTQFLRVNGTEIASNTGSATNNLNAFGLTETNRYNNGPISFLAVFDRELTGAELELVESIAAGTNGATIYVPPTILSRSGALLTSRSGATIIGR